MTSRYADILINDLCKNTSIGSISWVNQLKHNKVRFSNCICQNSRRWNRWTCKYVDYVATL